MSGREITRREFIRDSAIMLGAGWLWLNGIPVKASDKEVTSQKIKMSPWSDLGPGCGEVGCWAGDGCRSSLAYMTERGLQSIAATWKNGIHWMRGDGNWQEIPVDDDFGVVRHIIRGGDNLDILVADQGVRVVEKNSDLTEIINVGRIDPFSDPDGFLQAGGVSADGKLYVGGMGVFFKISGWEDTENGVVTVRQFPVPESEGQPMMIRTLSCDKSDPNHIYIGGWKGRSGEEKDADGNINPGMGVWETFDGGESWNQIMRDTNVNSIFDSGDGVLIVGTEGVGSWKSRVPSENFPCLFISRNGGSDWQVLNLPGLEWDVVSPNAGIARVGKDGVAISFWGGPVAVVPKILSKDKERNKPVECFWSDMNRQNWAAGHVSTYMRKKGEWHVATGGKNYHRNPADVFDGLRDSSILSSDYRVSLPVVQK